MAYSRDQWTRDLLRAIGNSNPSSAILSWMYAWEVEESGHGGRAGYNLLNSTYTMPGSTVFNSVGVKSYASYSDGITANAHTLLQQGLYTYVLQALKSNDANALGMSGSGVSIGVAGDLSTWVNGSRSPIATSYIAAILTIARNSSSYGGESLPGNATTGIIPALQPSQTVDQIFTQKGLWKWYNDHITWGFNGGNELGDDFATTWHTPVATPVAGTVQSIVHHNNSVSDVITIIDTSGGTWQYLHQDAQVRQGQTVQVGDVIGLENGLPVDAYSTGPHIEVRYKPAGQTAWSDPTPKFRSMGATTGVSGTGVSSSPILAALQAVTQSFNITTTSEQALAIINQVPGALGICEALDKVEQFVPFRLPTNTTSSQQSQPTGIPGVSTVTDVINIFGWNFSLPDIQIQDPASQAIAQTQAAALLPSDGIQAVLVFTVTNFFAFATRAIFVALGIVLLAALLLNLVSVFVKPQELASQVAPLMLAA